MTNYFRTTAHLSISLGFLLVLTVPVQVRAFCVGPYPTTPVSFSNNDVLLLWSLQNSNYLETLSRTTGSSTVTTEDNTKSSNNIGRGVSPQNPGDHDSLPTNIHSADDRRYPRNRRELVVDERVDELVDELVQEVVDDAVDQALKEQSAIIHHDRELLWVDDVLVDQVVEDAVDDALDHVVDKIRQETWDDLVDELDFEHGRELELVRQDTIEEVLDHVEDVDIERHLMWDDELMRRRTRRSMMWYNDDLLLPWEADDLFYHNGGMMFHHGLYPYDDGDLENYGGYGYYWGGFGPYRNGYRGPIIHDLGGTSSFGAFEGAGYGGFDGMGDFGYSGVGLMGSAYSGLDYSRGWNRPYFGNMYYNDRVFMGYGGGGRPFPGYDYFYRGGSYW